MTRRALWPERWPLIAHHVLDDGRTCVQAVEEAPDEDKADVKWNLPCKTCDKKGECLNAKSKTVGSLLYDREWMTRPRASESTFFPYELFEPMLRTDESLVAMYEKPFGHEHQYAVASAWDPAWSERTGGDYMVKITGVINRQTGKRKIIDILRVQRLTFEQQVKLIAIEHKKFNDDCIVIEGDFAQRIWAQYVNKHTDVPVLAHTARTKKDFELGIPGLVVELEQKLWEFPYKEGTFHHEEMEQLLNECESFGWSGDKLEGVGEHDDCVMAWWHLAWALAMMKPGRPMRRRMGIQRGVEI